MGWPNMVESTHNEGNLMATQVTVRATRHKMSRTYDSLKEAAYAFNCSPNSIKFASENATSFQGWYFKIIRNNVNRCVSCGVELNDTKDDYCNKCYYEELTGRSFMESQKIECRQEPKIMYQKGL